MEWSNVTSYIDTRYTLPKEHSLYLGGSLHHLSDVDHSELLEEVEEGSVEVLTAVLGEVGIRHVHQLQHSAGGQGAGGL